MEVDPNRLIEPLDLPVGPACGGGPPLAGTESPKASGFDGVAVVVVADDLGYIGDNPLAVFVAAHPHQ